MLIAKDGDFIRKQRKDVQYSANATFYDYDKCPNDCSKGEEMVRGIICMKLKDESKESCYWTHELDLIKLIYTEAGDNKVYEYRRVQFK